jgi:hypothetical protein
MARHHFEQPTNYEWLYWLAAGVAGYYLYQTGALTNIIAQLQGMLNSILPTTALVGPTVPINPALLRPDNITPGVQIAEPPAVYLHDMNLNSLS